MKITVLRLGHRPQRDKRLSTHLLLAARAFGADDAIYAGTEDLTLESSIEKIVEEWGGDFSLKYTDSFRSIIRNWEGKIAHLTMYGIPVQEAAPVIAETTEPLLVIVGGPKVPRDVYEAATWNVSVTNQPHSEVSALVLFLHILQGGAELMKEFKGARLKITPSEKGKDVSVVSKD